MKQKTCKIIEKEHTEYDEHDRCTELWHTFHCSACDYKFDTEGCEFCEIGGGEKMQNYCPNCGAKITK